MILTKTQIQDYFELLKILMGLSDWTLEIKDGEPDKDEAGASVVCLEGRKVAWIKIAVKFAGLAPQEQRAICVHELVHCHLEPVYHYVEPLLSRDQDQAFCHMEEYAVDGIAMAWAKALPLPDWCDTATGQSTQ
jgi:hypothetical protein